MNLLYDRNDGYKEYSVNRYSIGITFSNQKKSFLPYIRNYDELTEEQLLQLLKVAKEEQWTALDLSNCGLKDLPSELWEISTLKLLYLGNMSTKDTLNEIAKIPEEIIKLTNLEALSIANMKNPHIPDNMKKIL